MTEEMIFMAALEKEDPSARAAYLDEVCDGQPALRKRIAALLRSHADPDSFLDIPALARQAAAADSSSHTTELPAEDAEGLSEDQRSTRQGPVEAEPVPSDEALAFLAPGREAGSVGRLDHYEVLAEVGRGGMGMVFKAFDTKLKRIVAIKVLAPQLAANGTARKRFFREAQASAAVRDDHVVSIHAVSAESSVPYLVMEFIAGITLAERVQQSGPLEVKEILRIGLQAAKGLAAAHAQGLIHRDVKPANILLENGIQRVKITDFGLARAGDDASLTQPGVIAGTPFYMSPEQARGEALDRRSDLFSLGSVLYTLCTGRQAFHAGSTIAVLKRVCDDAPRPIREINPDIPDWLAAVVDKLLAKNPDDRYQSAAEVGAVLGEYLAHVQQPSLAARPPAALKQMLPPVARPTRKRRLLVITAMVVVAASLGALAVVVAWPQLFSPILDSSLSRSSEPGKDQLPAPKDLRPETETKQPPVDPRVLTVSKKVEDGGRFRSINEALEKVEPGMTIRVLDDAVYEEYLLIDQPDRHQGVVLEAVGKAAIRRQPKHPNIVWIKSVAGFTLRGFRFQSDLERHAQVGISGHCPGVVLDRLDLSTNEQGDCVNLYNLPLAGIDAPIVIQNCTMRGAQYGVLIEAFAKGDVDQALPCSHILIRNNTIVRCGQGVVLRGAVQRTLVVGNRIVESHWAAIDLLDLLPVAANILIANNTILRDTAALRVWDDSTKGKDFLKCQNIRFQNNLVLSPQLEVDLVCFDHPRGNMSKGEPGDIAALLKSPEWRFSHNWREVEKPKPGSPTTQCWIPEGPSDRLLVPINAGTRILADPNFLRPPKDSPLAKAGAGVEDPMLPLFVGAVPPDGVAPWEWEKTWKALAR